MSSSVLRNVIHPKAQTTPLEKVREDGQDPRSSNGAGAPFEFPKPEAEDMELVLGVLVENAPVAMAMFDRGMRYMLANRQWITEFGLQQVQPLVGKSQYEIFPGLHPGWRQVYERSLQGHIVRSEHDSLNGPDGRHLVYRWEVRPWRKKRDATVGGLMVTCEKFSSPQSSGEDADKAAPSSEDLGGAPPAAKTPDPLDCSMPMLVLNAEGAILRANVAAAHLTLDKGIQEGTTCFWEVFHEGRDYGVLRQQTLEALSRVSVAQDIVPVYVTTRADSTLDSAIPSRWLVSALAHKGSDESARQFMLMGFAAQTVVESVTRFTPPVAAPIPVVITAPIPAPAATVDDGAMLHLENELSRARQELRTLAEAQQAFGRREARLRSYLEGVPCGVFVLDERGVPVFQNERLAKLLGRPLEADQTVESWLAHACPTEEHRAQVVLAWRESVWRRQLTRTVSLATADGLLKELEFHPIALPGGGLLVSIQDATEHTRHEEQLRSMEAKLRTLMQGSPIAIVMTDKAGVIFEVNQHAEVMLGQAKSELRRYPLDAWLDPDSATARRDALRALHSSGRQAEALSVRVKRVDGSFSRAILHLAAVPDAQGETHCTIHYLQEVAEPAPVVIAPAVVLPVAHANTTTRSEPASAVLLTTDANGRVRTWTEHAQTLLGLEAAAAIGRPLHQFFRPSDATAFFADLAEQTANPQSIVQRPYFGGNGKRGEAQISARMLEDGGFELISHFTAEVEADAATVPPQSEALPQAALPLAFQVVSPSSARWPVVDLEREKLLLTETHHRIKNHLQIISSLLNMQINGVSDQDARNALRSSQNRVRAIAALHQHLYQIALGKGDTFSDFTRDLVSHLRECYEVQSDQIKVHMEVQEGPIEQEWLMPLALTLNEALSNCFEHAYPHGRQGQITAMLHYSQGSGELIVRDDGVGLPADYHPGEGSGLGLKILAVFADQMRGQLFVQANPDQGTEIKLRFPLASPEA